MSDVDRPPPEQRARLVVDVLAATDVEAIAQRVVELLEERGAAPSAVDPEQRMSPAAVAKLADLDASTVRRAIRRGELPAHRIGSRLKLRYADVIAWMNREPVEQPKHEPQRSAVTRSFRERTGSFEALRRIEREAGKS